LEIKDENILGEFIKRLLTIQWQHILWMT
jgi:hypothetical protein